MLPLVSIGCIVEGTDKQNSKKSRVLSVIMTIGSMRSFGPAYVLTEPDQQPTDQ